MRVSPRSEESIGQSDFPDVFHERIVDEVSIDEEEDGQIDLFTGENPLFFETETFDFGEIWCDVIRSDVVSRDANDIFVAQVLGGVKSESRLSRQNPHFFLLRRERPREAVTRVGVELDFDALVQVGPSDETFFEELGRVRHGRPGVARRRTEDPVEGDGQVRGRGHEEDGRGGIEEERSVAFFVVRLLRSPVLLPGRRGSRGGSCSGRRSRLRRGGETRGSCRESQMRESWGTR